MLHEDLTEKIIKACFTVSNELGNGFLESVYEKALLIVLGEMGLQVFSQVPLKVHFHDQVIGEFYPDIVVEDSVLIELKAVKSLSPEHIAQVINYLKVSGLGVGLLVNFGNPKLEYRRFGNRF